MSHQNAGRISSWNPLTTTSPQTGHIVHDFLQEWAGSALTGDCSDEAMLFLYGRHGSGKSTFAETLLEVFAGYGAMITGSRSNS